MSKFTLVSTTFNEANRLEKSIQDIEDQVLLPDEIIITDAGSNDGTLEKLEKWASTSSIAIKILVDKGCNVAKGRNLAIKNAKYSLIVSTDFGCRYHPDWLKELTLPFNVNNISVVGGFFGVKEDEIKTLASRANYILSNGYKCVNDGNFIPSSRSIAYLKSVWEDVGGYPEWLTLAADDLVFGKALLAKGYRFHIVEKQHVYWGRHKLRQAYAKEAFRYGLGDGEAKVNVRNTLKLFIEAGLRYAFPMFVLFAIFISPLFCIGAVLCSLGFKPYRYAYKQWQIFKSEKYNFSTFLEALKLIELTRYNYLKGYYKGYNSKSEARINGLKHFQENSQLS